MYLSTDIAFVDLYWRFYLTKYGRDELLKQTVYFDPRGFDVHAIPDRSLILERPGELANGDGSGRLKRVRLIESLDRTVCCEVLETGGRAVTP